MVVPGGVSYHDTAKERIIREYRQSSALASESREEWIKRWMLSLAIGNGAGAVSFSSALVSSSGEQFRTPVLVGIWCFALGLMSAGLIPLIHALKFESLRELFHIWADEQEQGGTVNYPLDDGDIETSDYLADRAESNKHRLELWVLRLQLAAALAFALGITIPLVIITLGFGVGHGEDRVLDAARGTQIVSKQRSPSPAVAPVSTFPPEKPEPRRKSS